MLRDVLVHRQHRAEIPGACVVPDPEAVESRLQHPVLTDRPVQREKDGVGGAAEIDDPRADICLLSSRGRLNGVEIGLLLLYPGDREGIGAEELGCRSAVCSKVEIGESHRMSVSDQRVGDKRSGNQRDVPLGA